LLRGQVAGIAKNHVLGERVFSEAGQMRATAFVKEYVLGMEMTVDDASDVGVLERDSYIANDPDGVLDRRGTRETDTAH